MVTRKFFGLADNPSPILSQQLTYDIDGDISALVLILLIEAQYAIFY